MGKLEETTALAIVFGNTRRKKRKENLVSIAKAFEYLVKLHGSQRAAAEKVGLSAEMIRQFLTVLKLPDEVQQLFAKRQLDSVDVAKDLVALKDKSRQIAVAKKITGLLSTDARDIQRIVKGGQVPAKEARKLILQAKKEGLHIFMVDFDDETSRKVVREAKRLKKGPAELLREVILEWLNRKNERQRDRR